MKQQKLRQEKVRYHDNMKQRPNNPTFTSNNVWGSLKIQSMPRSKSYSQLAMSKKFDFADKITQRNTSSIFSNNDNQSSPTKEGRSHSRRSQSNLLSYGLNSLEPLRKSINSKEIYEKQAKKYNIVTIQPKQYVDTINLFPKLRLENSDQSIYKRINVEKQLSQSRLNFDSNQKAESILNKKLIANPEQQRLVV